MLSKMRLRIVVWFVLCALSAAQLKGFNYGATNPDGSCRNYNDFVRYFNEAKNLAGSTPFNGARLFTAVQCGSVNSPSEAFQAAIDTDTKILVGLWCSGGRTLFENELNALIAGANQHGEALTSRIIGISVGSEDLYRASPQGQANNAGPGASASDIEGYIGWTRDWMRGKPLGHVPIGHVDTWTAWTLPENKPVANAVDFLGHNSFPYFETTKPNAISQAKNNFFFALGQTEGVANGKPVWVTETGWPHRGPQSGGAVANTENARTYWREVGCELFGKRNTFWYTLKDSNPDQTQLSFGITPLDSSKPYFDLQC